MFDKITVALPAIEEYVSVLKAQSDKRGQPLPLRLTMALACVYVDLIQFCQEICKLFAGKRGMRRAIFLHSIVMNLTIQYSIWI